MWDLLQPQFYPQSTMTSSGFKMIFVPSKVSRSGAPLWWAVTILDCMNHGWTIWRYFKRILDPKGWNLIQLESNCPVWIWHVLIHHAIVDALKVWMHPWRCFGGCFHQLSIVLLCSFAVFTFATWQAQVRCCQRAMSNVFLCFWQGSLNYPFWGDQTMQIYGDVWGISPL